MLFFFWCQQVQAIRALSGLAGEMDRWSVRVCRTAEDRMQHGKRMCAKSWMLKGILVTNLGSLSSPLTSEKLKLTSPLLSILFAYRIALSMLAASQ